MKHCQLSSTYYYFLKARLLKPYCALVLILLDKICYNLLTVRFVITYSQLDGSTLDLLGTNLCLIYLHDIICFFLFL